MKPLDKINIPDWPDSVALFEVGEGVILQSKGHPQLDGDYIVTERSGPEILFCAITGEESYGFSYKLNTELERYIWWGQEVLRKKHSPGGSFESTMSSLKSQTIASYIDGKANRLAEILSGANQVKED